MSVLVGRERELALLDQALASVGSRSGAPSSGQLVLVTGEAGIGKSALMLETQRRARAAGFRTARAVATDDPGAPALWLWQRLARDLPELGPLCTSSTSDGATGRFAIFEAVRECLAASAESPRHRGLGLFLDDVHWADVTSLHLLRHLALDLSETRLLLVVSARDTGPPAWQEIRWELARGSGSRVLTLPGLSER